jgi:hypothetical protein
MILPKKLYEKDHPDYFPPGGTGQFYWSLKNPEVMDEVVWRLEHFLARHPEIEKLDFWPSDGVGDIDPDDYRAATGEEGRVLQCGDRALELGRRTLLMGILNVTPDSFSGDGLASDVDAAIEQARAFVDAGCDVLDVGGESTRPGSEGVSVDEELERVLPVLGVHGLVHHIPTLSSAGVALDDRENVLAQSAGHLVSGGGRTVQLLKHPVGRALRMVPQEGVSA